MSAGASTDQSDVPETTHSAIQPAQQTAAKFVGFLYILTNITAIIGFYLRGRLMVRGDAVQTARNIVASGQLLRMSIVAELVTVAGVIVLVVGLYVVLRPINRNVAFLAAFWRAAENIILAVIVLSEFAMLALLSGADYLRAVDPNQLQALAYLLVRVYGDGFRVGFVFLGLGSATFSYLWFKSRYVPRALAAWGIFSSSLLAGAELAIIASPGLAGVLGFVYMAPMGIYEFGLGFWLLIRGIRAPSA